MAAAFVGLAFVCTLYLQRFFPYPFLFLFFAAVMASAWFGGTEAGFFAVLVSTLVAAYFFVPPYRSWAITPTALSYFVAFIACALVVSWVSSARRKTDEELRETRDQLEIRVAERTADLMRTQSEVARLSRVLSMGELTASIAHEISQPLTAVVTHGQACLEWLSGNPPNLEKARHTTESIVRDGIRAGAVIDRVRALFRKEEPVKDWTGSEWTDSRTHRVPAQRGECASGGNTHSTVARAAQRDGRPGAIAAGGDEPYPQWHGCDEWFGGGRKRIACPVPERSRRSDTDHGRRFGRWAGS